MGYLVALLFLPIYLIFDGLDFFKKYPVPKFLGIFLYEAILILLIINLTNQEKTGFSEEEQLVEQSVDEQIAKDEVEIQNDLERFYDSLRSKNSISPTFEPEFQYRNEIIDYKRIVSSEFGYTAPDNEFELSNYQPGDYHYYDSESTIGLLLSVDRAINRYLQENLKNSQEIQLELHGFADAIPYDPQKPTYYSGLEGSFPKRAEETPNGQKIDHFTLNNVITPIQLKEGDVMTNEILAFLRAYSLYIDYLITVPEIRSVERKTRVVYYATTFSKNSEKGGEYRKVKVKIDVINPTNFPPPPERPLNDGCNRIWQLICGLLAVLIGSFAFFHYKRYHEKRDKGESGIKDLILMFVIIAIALLVALMALFYCDVFT